MSEEVKINKQANSISFTNNNISFSQFGIAKEILELIENQQSEIERLNNIIEQTQKILYIKLMNENKEKIYIQEVIDIIENLKGSDKE